MANQQMPHPGHDKHLCYLNNIGFHMSHAEDYKQLVKNGQYYCQICGRVAADEKNLCQPVKL
jgi:hypothetical protein